MNQEKRRTIVSCLTALLVASIGIYLILHQRSQIATQLVIRELTKRGIAVDSLEVEKLGIRGVTLNAVRLRLPNGWIVSLDGVNASYSRDSIGDRELESVEIERARFAQPQTAAPSTESKTNSLSLPFAALKCRRLELSLVASNYEVALEDLNVTRSEDKGSIHAVASAATVGSGNPNISKSIDISAAITTIDVHTLVESLSRGRIDSIRMKKIDGALSSPVNNTPDSTKSQRSTDFHFPNIALPFSSLLIADGILRGIPVVQALSFKGAKVEPNVAQRSFVLSADSMKTSLFDGEIRVEPLTVNSMSKQNSVLVRLRGVDLKSILALYEEQGVSGTGLVDGELPVELSDGKVTIKGGSVSVRKPGGILRYEGAAVPAGGSDSRLNLVREALKNYHYDLLQAGVDYNANGDVVLQASIEGTNPDLNMTQPIHVNLTVSENVPSLVRSLEVAGKLEAAVRGAVSGK